MAPGIWINGVSIYLTQGIGRTDLGIHSQKYHRLERFFQSLPLQHTQGMYSLVHVVPREETQM